MKTITVKAHSEAETLTVAAQFAKQITAPAVVFLEGPLGAGKTTFVRGFLRALGYQGRVKSPTFTLVETYEIDHYLVAHFDLYRLKDPSELENIGYRDYLAEDCICLVEWGSLASDQLPLPTVLCTLKRADQEDMRLIEIEWLGKQ